MYLQGSKEIRMIAVLDVEIWPCAPPPLPPTKNALVLIQPLNLMASSAQIMFYMMYGVFGCGLNWSWMNGWLIIRVSDCDCGQRCRGINGDQINMPRPSNTSYIPYLDVTKGTETIPCLWESGWPCAPPPLPLTQKALVLIQPLNLMARSLQIMFYMI